MTNKSKNNGINPDQDHVLDLRGSEQHHSLKNQHGEKGDPDHTQDGGGAPDEITKVIKDVVSDADKETPMIAALKKAVR